MIRLTILLGGIGSTYLGFLIASTQLDASSQGFDKGKGPMPISPNISIHELELPLMVNRHEIDPSRGVSLIIYGGKCNECFANSISEVEPIIGVDNVVVVFDDKLNDQKIDRLSAPGVLVLGEVNASFHKTLRPSFSGQRYKFNNGTLVSFAMDPGELPR